MTEVEPIRDKADQAARSFVADVLKRKGEDDQCAKDPLLWLTQYTRTRDDHWREKGTEPYAKFPLLPYFPWSFELFQTKKVLFIPKSRDMRITWCVCAYLVWTAQYHGPAHIMIQTQKEDKARDLVSGLDVPGYVRTLYEQQPDWMRLMHPTSRAPEDMAGLVFTWKNGSKIEGIPTGAAQIRQYHPAIVFFDEAAFLDDWYGSFQAALPVAGQIISVSSAAPSAFGDMVHKIEDAARAQGTYEVGQDKSQW